MKLLTTLRFAILRSGSMNALYIGYTVSLIWWMISSGSCPLRSMSLMTLLTRSKCTPPEMLTLRSCSGRSLSLSA